MHEYDPRQAVIPCIAELKAKAPGQRNAAVNSNGSYRDRNDRPIEKLKVFLRTKIARRGDCDFTAAQTVEPEPANRRKQQQYDQFARHC